jgi:hypothetical protein
VTKDQTKVQSTTPNENGETIQVSVVNLIVPRRDS